MPDVDPVQHRTPNDPASAPEDLAAEPVAGAPIDDVIAPHRAGFLFGLGLFSLLCCGPLGILTWLLANADLRAMRSGRMDPSGETWTFNARVFAITAVAIFAAEILLVVVYLSLRAVG